MCTQDACHSCRHRYLYHFRCIWISEFWPAVPLVQFLKCRHGVHRRRRPWVSESALGLGIERMAGAMDRKDFPKGFGVGFCLLIFRGKLHLSEPNDQRLRIGSTSLWKGFSHWLRNNYPLVIKHGNPQLTWIYRWFPISTSIYRGVPLPSLIIDVP
jgi:hypothetical protein